MKYFRAFALVVCSLSSLASAQSFNIDVGTTGSGPSSSYGAAGQAGVWNRVRAEHMTPFMTGPHPSDYMLVDITGAATGVGLHQYGGMADLNASDLSVSGNDADLLNDAILTHSIPLETCVYLNGLQNGLYEVLIYAWRPNNPAFIAQTRFDFHPELETVGGAWPGAHQEGVTYSRHIVQVNGGFMGLHIGIPSGGSTAIGAAWNGMQVRKIAVTSVPAIESAQGALLMASLLIAGAWVFSRLGAVC